MTDTTPLEKAEVTLANLDAALLRLKARGVELEDQRTNIALSAHTGDEKARKKLDQLNTQIATHHSEVMSLNIAVGAQEQVVRQAKQAEQRAAAAVDADNLKKIVRHRKKIAAEFDNHIQKACDLLADYKAAAEAASALAAVPPTAMQMLTFCEAVVHGYFMRTFVKRGFRHLTPRETLTLSQLDAQWSDPVLARLEEKEDAA